MTERSSLCPFAVTGLSLLRRYFRIGGVQDTTVVWELFELAREYAAGCTRQGAFKFVEAYRPVLGSWSKSIPFHLPSILFREISTGHPW